MKPMERAFTPKGNIDPIRAALRTFLPVELRHHWNPNPNWSQIERDIRRIAWGFITQGKYHHTYGIRLKGIYDQLRDVQKQAQALAATLRKLNTYSEEAIAASALARGVGSGWSEAEFVIEIPAVGSDEYEASSVAFEPEIEKETIWLSPQEIIAPTIERTEALARIAENSLNRIKKRFGEKDEGGPGIAAKIYIKPQEFLIQQCEALLFNLFPLWLIEDRLTTNKINNFVRQMSKYATGEFKKLDAHFSEHREGNFLRELKEKRRADSGRQALLEVRIISEIPANKKERLLAIKREKLIGAPPKNEDVQ